MIELKNQKFDVVLAPADAQGQPLDETKKGLLTLKIKFVASGGQPAAGATGAPSNTEPLPAPAKNPVIVKPEPAP